MVELILSLTIGWQWQQQMKGLELDAAHDSNTLLGIQAQDNPESPPLHNTDAGSIHDIDCLLNFRNFKG
ncbi:hypothetical protein J6590_085754 [Homalodisca vitripennis]|nr:hypothetical protein J6590_085754 [Homalodisca vitripennis]